MKTSLNYFGEFALYAIGCLIPVCKLAGFAIENIYLLRPPCLYCLWCSNIASCKEKNMQLNIKQGQEVEREMNFFSLFPIFEVDEVAGTFTWAEKLYKKYDLQKHDLVR